MCGGFQYKQTDENTGEVKVKKVFFPIKKASIPYIEDGEVKLGQWGKRKGEDEGLDVPQTGWARIESLKAHKWDQYSPRRVRIPALSWMEKDKDRQSHWFDMAADSYLLGIKIEKDGQSFIYIVTMPATEWFKAIHEREPMVVHAEKTV